jgi:hypothetical protein
MHWLQQVVAVLMAGPLADTHRTKMEPVKCSVISSYLNQPGTWKEAKVVTILEIGKKCFLLQLNRVFIAYTYIYIYIYIMYIRDILYRMYSPPPPKVITTTTAHPEKAAKTCAAWLQQQP